MSYQRIIITGGHSLPPTDKPVSCKKAVPTMPFRYSKPDYFLLVLHISIISEEEFVRNVINKLSACLDYENLRSFCQ